MTGANCYWALLRHDGSGTLETATSTAASLPASLAREASSSSSSSPLSSEDEQASSTHSSSSSPADARFQLFHLFDAALRGFLASARCLTRDSERYSVEARSLAGTGNFDAAFNFLGRALEAAAISKAMSELEASRAAATNNNESSSSSSSSSEAASLAAATAAAASVSATTAAFSSHVSRCAEATRALAAVRRAAPAAYAVLSQVMTARAAAPPPPVPLFSAVGGGATSSVTFFAAAVAVAAKPPPLSCHQKPSERRPQRSPLTDALRDRLKALAAGAGCLPTWPPRGASSALLC